MNTRSVEQVKQLAKRSPKDQLENSFLYHWSLLFPQLPPPVRQHKPIPGRRFACDFAWVEERLAVEIMGGSYIKGGHNTAVGQAKDYEKHNNMTRLGWSVLYYSTPMCKHMTTVVEEVAEVLCHAEEVTPKEK